MKSTALKAVTQKTGEFVYKNSPTILTALGVAGFLSTIAFSVKGTTKAMILLKEEEARRQKEMICEGQTGPIEDPLPISAQDTIKLTWKCYIPTAAMCLVSVGCVVGANSVNLRRNAAIASLYSIADAALKEYQEKVVEVIGENKELKIRDDIAQDRLNAHPLGKDGRQIIVTGSGRTLCFDALSGRYFESDVESIRRAQNTFNHTLLNDMYLSLNEFYEEIGLPGTEMGRDMGWSVEYGMLDITYSSKLTTEGLPCLVLNYRVGPRKL